MGIRAARRKVRHVLPAVVILVTAAGMVIGGDSAAIIPSLGEVAVTVDLAITAAYSPLALATTGEKDDATSYAGIWDAERSVFCGPELLARYRAGMTWVRAARRARGLPRLAVDVSAPIVDVVQEDHDGVLVSGTISVVVRRTGTGGAEVGPARDPQHSFSAHLVARDGAWCVDTLGDERIDSDFALLASSSW